MFHFSKSVFFPALIYNFVDNWGLPETTEQVPEMLLSNLATPSITEGAGKDSCINEIRPWPMMPTDLAHRPIARRVVAAF